MYTCLGLGCHDLPIVTLFGCRWGDLGVLVGVVPRPFDLLSVELNLLLRGFSSGGGDLTLLPLFRVDLSHVMAEWDLGRSSLNSWWYLSIITLGSTWGVSTLALELFGETHG